MDLTTLGWLSFPHSDGIDTSMVARVLAVHRSHLRAATAEKEINLHFSGQLYEPPVVGDWVLTTPEFEDEQGEPAALAREILPRKSTLSRGSESGEKVMVANIDTVFIVTSANMDLNTNRLQRFLLLVRESGAEPVIVISKMDLAKTGVVEQIGQQLGIQTVGTSMIEQIGLEEVRKLMPRGSTSVFVGSSGVGKSSLVNGLMGEDIQVTREIREDDDKGRHATTGRQMFETPGGGLIIDTPGIREVSVLGSRESVDDTFSHIAQLAKQCRFANCQHGDEPGCAVQAALASGELDQREWENYQKLQKEVAYARRKADKAEAANSKKRWRDINMMMRKKRRFEERE